jgi:hypothetical protein
MFDLQALALRVIETEALDLHLKVPSRRSIRTHGILEAIPDSDPLVPDGHRGRLQEMLTEPLKLEEFSKENEVDFSYAVPAWPASASTPSSSAACLARLPRDPHDDPHRRGAQPAARDRRAGQRGARHHPR